MRVPFALLTACIAFGATAGAATAKPLDGATDIRDVKVVRPTTGAERGSLLVWVKVRHAGVSDPGLAGATHRGTVDVRIPGVGRRTATRELTSVAGERGYTVRLRGADLLNVPSVGVRVTATETVDTDGDGTVDGRSGDTSVLNKVAPTPVARSIAPPNGTYGLNGFPNDNGFAVQGGEVEVFWVSSDVGCVNDVVPKAPIDPVTGAFAFDFKGVKGSGTFAADGRSAVVDANWQGVLGAGGPKCEGALPAGSPYRYASA